MPIVFRQVTSQDLAKTKRELTQQFLGARFGWPPDVKSSLLEVLLSALETGGEEAIQKGPDDQSLLDSVCRQRIWPSWHLGIPQSHDQATGADGISGLIPDYLIITRSSLGYFWHVVELKRFDVQFANRTGDGYSAEGNKAIAQCNEYLTHFQDYIDAVRSNIHIAELIQPEGAILLIGDSEKESEAQRRCRSNFVRNNPKIDVVSYNRIIRGLRSNVDSRQGP